MIDFDARGGRSSAAVLAIHHRHDRERGFRIFLSIVFGKIVARRSACIEGLDGSKRSCTTIPD
jgi:hypothetical protein